MDLEIINLNGYGQYVWSAFILTFSICFILYSKTKKEFLREEKIYLKTFPQVKSKKITPSKQEEILLKSPVF